MLNAFTIPVINTHLHNNLYSVHVQPAQQHQTRLSRASESVTRGVVGDHCCLVPLYTCGCCQQTQQVFSQNSIKLYLSEMNTWLFNISMLASIYEAVEKRVASLESKPSARSSGLINDYLTNVKLSRSNCALVKCKKTSQGIRFQYWGKVTPTAIAAIGCQLLWNNTLINGSVHDILEMHSADLRERSMDWIV